MADEKDRIERVITGTPLNVTAGKVMSIGIHYTPDLSKSSHELHENQPPIRPIPEHSLHSCQDLPGKKVGRFTVIGLAEEFNPKKNARWVVRCSCGRYEFRKAKALRNPSNIDDCCSECKNLKMIQYRYRKKGSRAPTEFK